MIGVGPYKLICRKYTKGNVRGFRLLDRPPKPPKTDLNNNGNYNEKEINRRKRSSVKLLIGSMRMSNFHPKKKNEILKSCGI
jgi:hypothetical protein